MSDLDRQQLPERDREMELDRAIDALNHERQPATPASDPDGYWTALEAAMLVRSLRPPEEPEAEFPGRLAARLAGTVAERSPNGHMPYTPVARAPARGSRHLRSALLPALQTTGAYALAGMAAGVLVGGVGARIAMRVSAEMFAREHPNRFAISESSGNLVGRFTWSGTFSLISEAMLFGLIGGLFYLVARRWLPRSPRASGLLFGLLLLLVAGATVISADNGDFRRIGSPVLNVAMFGAIFVVFGLAVAPLSRWITLLVSRTEAASGLLRRLGRLVLGGFGVLGLLGIAGVVVAGVITLYESVRHLGDGDLGATNAAEIIAIAALTVILPVSWAALAAMGSGLIPSSRRAAAITDWIGRAGLGIAALAGAAITLAEIAGILDLF